MIEEQNQPGSLSIACPELVEGKGPNRNGIIDFFKYIAAIGVILVHIPLPGVWGILMNAVGVCGVGFFYIITGYACWGTDKALMCRKILKRLRRNGIITIITVAVYFIFAWFYKKRIYALYPLKRALRLPSTYLSMILLGDFELIYGAALWFMIALLYCYIIFYVIVRFDLKKVVYIMTIPLLILRIVVDTYVNSYPVSWHLSGNLIVGALPMVCLGYIIADQKERLKNIKNWILILVSILSTLAMFVTVLFYIGRFNISQPFKILCAASIFVYGINNPDRHICKPLEKCARQDTLLIYLSHFLLIIILSEKIYSLRPLPKHLDWYLPLAVIVASLLLARVVSVLINLVKKVIENKSKKEEISLQE